MACSPGGGTFAPGRVTAFVEAVDLADGKGTPAERALRLGRLAVDVEGGAGDVAANAG